MNTPAFLAASQLQSLIDRIRSLGYSCVGPQVIDNAILYRDFDQVSQLPLGVEQTQSPGSYRLIATDHTRHFSWANGPQALKPLTFVPREDLWTAQLDEAGELQFTEVKSQSEKRAVFGVRACDLAALKMHDQHFGFKDDDGLVQDAAYPDTHYAARRENLLLIGVHCTHPADTCFCASTGDGPEIREGADLTLHETDQGYFIEAHSLSGRQVLEGLDTKPGAAEQFARAQSEVKAAATQQRSVPATDLKGILFDQLESPIWSDIAERCLSCGNCTQVCPTCFCHSESEVPELDGNSSTHQRQWDSCFTADHSYIHGLHVRDNTEARYRQWLTHKFGSWHDQFGRSGCVGCGRCIAWCPVGIDPTEELNRLFDAAGDRS